MDEKRLQAFRSHDWEEISAKVLAAAVVLAARYGWKADTALPNGCSIEDLVIEAISEIWEKPERLNPSMTITAQLKGIVRSKLWNLSQSSDEKVKRSEILAEVVPDARNDCDHGEIKVQFDRAIQSLLEHPKVKKSPDLELVVMGLSCGASDTKQLEKETGLSHDRIYQMQRELRALYPSIASQLRAGVGTP
jgi:hypothetical protein